MTKAELDSWKLAQREKQMEDILARSEARRSVVHPPPCEARAFCTLPDLHDGSCDELFV